MQLQLVTTVGITLAALTSCGGSEPTNSAGVSGSWEGKFTLEGVDFATVKASLSQTNKPVTGDYTGQMTLTSSDLNETSRVTGNTTAGTLNIIEEAGAILCKGTYANAAQYSGTCTFNYEDQNYSLSIAMQKR